MMVNTRTVNTSKVCTFSAMMIWSASGNAAMPEVIAALYEVSPSAIFMVTSGKTWKRVL